MIKLELLAPAGNTLKMKTAFAFGADAVYLGIPDFSLRVRINDFDLKGIKEGVAYAHKLKKKVYVTVNIFGHNKHLQALPPYIRALKKIGVDALIISDPGIISLVKRVWPQAEIHLSTQANCTNFEAVKFWARQGVKRIVLGREVTLEEIKEIHRAAPRVELEYFIHGAMCMAYSGRCFLSKLLVGRSGNLGDCAQPCRFPYEVTLKAPRQTEELELVREVHGSYLLNSKDLCLIKHLEELRLAGITSFKIEGRAKSVYYQAVVCGVYRRALSSLAKKLTKAALTREINYLYQELETKLVHRGYTTGFLLQDKADQNITDAKQSSAFEFCGQVLKTEPSEKGKTKVYFKVHNTIKVGDEVEIIRPNYDIIKLRPKTLWDAQEKISLSEAHGGGGGREAIIEVPTTLGDIPALSVLRRRIK